MNRRPSKFLLIVLFATLAQRNFVAAAAAAPTTAPSDLLVHGSADMYWIARIGPAAPGASSNADSLIQARRIGGDPHFKIIGQFGAARVTSITSRGNQLAVLLDSGDWRLIWEEQGSSGGALPQDGSKLLALAGAPDVLWAIAAAGEGPKPSTKPSASTSTQPSTAVATTQPAGTKLLYRLDQGRWNVIQPLPPSASQAITISLVVVGGKPVVAILLDPGQVRVFSWNDDSDCWEALGMVEARAGAETSRVKVLGNLDRLALWVADAHGPGELFLRDDKWGKAIPLTATGPKGASIDTNAKDVTVAGQSIRLVTLADQKLTEYAFNTEGTSQGSLDLPMPAPSQERPTDWVTAVAAAMLMVVLVHSVRRRGSTTSEAIEAAGLKIAPYGLRLLAGTIDALPVLGTIFVMALRLDESDRADPQALVASVFIPFQIAIGVYVLITLASELMWGWTIGKRLCGLRAVMLDGSEMRPRAIFIRNLLRVVDAALLGLPLLLVFVAPLRQRVGDAAADTVVVMAHEITPKEEE